MRQLCTKYQNNTEKQERRVVYELAIKPDSIHHFPHHKMSVPSPSYDSCFKIV